MYARICTRNYVLYVEPNRRESTNRRCRTINLELIHVFVNLPQSTARLVSMLSPIKPLLRFMTDFGI